MLFKLALLIFAVAYLLKVVLNGLNQRQANKIDRAYKLGPSRYHR